MTVEYTVIEKVPSAEAFCHLRVAAGMSPRPLEGARAGLPQQALSEITGEFTSDDLLGRIFSSFCIGK